MGRQNDINFLKAAGILVSLIIVFASLVIYGLSDNRTPYYSPSKTAVGQEQGQGEQDNSSDESDMAVNNISELSLPELFSKVEKSVVQVANKEEAGIMIGERLGSGFVYDKSGHIVTNYHVIAGGATEGIVQITFLDGSTYNARLVGGDPFSDLAVLQLEGENIPEEKLIPLPIGDSTSLRIGEQIVAIGNPFGLSGSMTEGIISGLGRLIPSSPESPRNPSDDTLPPAAESPSSTYSIPDIIQIDAPINPGNSGGPLLNIKGEVIGINTAIFSTTGASAGIGFAIPSNTIKKVVPSLIASGDYQHPYLGIIGVDISPEIADALGLEEARGFLVTDVSRGSPAQKAGIQGGNSLANVNGREIAMGGDVILKVDEHTVRK